MSFDLTKVDIDRLKADVSDALAGALIDLVEGAEKDVKAYASQISMDLLEAHMIGNAAITARLLDQLKILAEINRVRITNTTWAVITSVTKAIFAAAVSGVISVLL